jgi:hypothetical protein
VTGLSPEQLFLSYAYSCGEVQQQHLGTITEDEIGRTRRMLDGKERVDLAFLKEKYRAAFHRLDLVAAATGLPQMSAEALDAYFILYHNLFIDARDGSYAKLPKTICDYCKVHVVRVKQLIRIKPRQLLFYRFEPIEDEPVLQGGVSGELVPDARVGDLIVIHQALAVKRIDESYYRQLKERYLQTPLYNQLSRGIVPT